MYYRTHSFGPGVELAVLDGLLDYLPTLLPESTPAWTAHGRFKVLNVLPVPTTKMRAVVMRSLGFVTLASIVRTLRPPRDVSPHLLTLIMDGPLGVTLDLNFLQKIDPDRIPTVRPFIDWAESSPRPWPLSNTSLLPGLLTAIDLHVSSLLI